MGYYFRRLLIALGYQLCPVCGSKNITVRGFEENRRYDCAMCGSVTQVSRW